MAEGTGVDRAVRFRWDGPVPKFDAFGREIGEDTLSGLGGSEPAPQATPQPVPATSWSESPAAATFGAPVEDPPAAPPQPQPAAPQATFTIPGTIPVSSIPGVRRRRGMSGFGCLIGIVVLAAVVAGPIIAIVSFVGAADDAIDDVTGIIDGATTIDPAPEIDRPPPVGIAGRSMVSEANFGAALRRVGDKGLGQPLFIRLSPDRASLQMLKGNKLRPNVTLDYLGGLNLGVVSTGGSGASTFKLDSIDPGAPARLVRASAERFPALKPNQIDYLVASRDAIEGGHRWVAYFKDKGYVLGSESGRVERRFKP